ncbi:MAG: hypothetical protein WBF71_08585 [Microthrixaceae bacterium]
MTIRKGEPWGAPGTLAEGSPVVDGDRALARKLEELLTEEALTEPVAGTAAGTAAEPVAGPVTEVPDQPAQDQRAEPVGGAAEVGHPVEIGLLGGDLHKSVGAPSHSASDLFDGCGVRLPIDVGVVEFEDHGVQVRRLFVAHLVARVGRTGGLWSGRTAIVMNGSFIGTANLGPKAHPNDGRLDVVDGRLSLGDRRKARPRMATGTHVPHPSLVELRVKRLVLSDDRPFRVRVDGESVGSAGELTIRCVPDAAVIVV